MEDDFSVFLLLAAVAEEEEKQRAVERARRVLLAYRLRQTLRTRNYVMVADLEDPAHSWWPKFYRDASDSAFVSELGLNRAAFEELLVAFDGAYVVKSGDGKPGRPPKLPDKAAVLALLLCFYSSRGERKELCTKFGVPPATNSRVLDNAERALYEALEHVESAAITWPSKAQQLESVPKATAKRRLPVGFFAPLSSLYLRRIVSTWRS
ncbi:hypothetical protein DFJ74DRAFT_162149 [Hyaloraphidium curvatum]|nr:hypothetical protein DFJ74DRAFT_162149 [Hyaloraphidium curvatum]